MAMAERRDSLVEFVNSEGSVTFAQIKRRFPDVSEMTLRTDLKALDQQHQIIRVHGGAKSVGFAVGTDDLLARRVGRRSAEKTDIAKKAAALIAPGHTIFIDSGSSTTALAAAIEDMELLVFTNSLTVAKCSHQFKKNAEHRNCFSHARRFLTVFIIMSDCPDILAI